MTLTHPNSYDDEEAGMLVDYESSSSDEPAPLNQDINRRQTKRERSPVNINVTTADVAKASISKTDPADSTLSGIYIPPFKRRNTTADATSHEKINTTTITDQRNSWEDLKRKIHGTINRLNTSTIQSCILQLISSANLIRGKGVLTKALLRAAITSPPYAPVYASFIAVISSKLPEIGELLLIRTLDAFQKHYSRKEKKQTLAVVGFLGHLFNQGLCHELLCLQLETLLLEEPISDDGIEVAMHLFYIIGQALIKASPAGVRAIMERFRVLLQEGKIHPRIQYKTEELMKERKRNFQDYPSLLPELDLVEKEDQIMFDLSLDDDLDRQDELDLFRMDTNFEANETVWANIQRELVGDEDENENKSKERLEEDAPQHWADSQDIHVEEEEEENEDATLEEVPVPTVRDKGSQLSVIHDLSEKDLIHLRRTIYLTIMSSASFEECAHKLTKIDIPMGKENELINMIIECCSQERTFLRYYGMVSGRFCLIHDRWRRAFEQSFVEQYNTIHRLETNKLRNVAKLFAHLLHTDSMPWSVLSVIHLNEDETTSSSRIFIKVLVQTLAETLGMAVLLERFETDDPETNEWFQGMFPKDNPRNTRYAINFFTSIGLGPLTDGLRDYLKNAPKLIMLQAQAESAKKVKEESSHSESSDDSSSVSSSSSSSSSYTSSSTSSSNSSSSSSSNSSSSSSRSSSSNSSYTSNSTSRSGSRSFSSSSDSSRTSRSRRSRSRRSLSRRGRSNHGRNKKRRSNRSSSSSRDAKRKHSSSYRSRSNKRRRH